MKTDKELAAACGLFCGACSLYIGTTEDPVRLEKLTARMGRTTEEMVCRGCRSDQRSFYCQTCRLYACAAAKEHEFCGQCAEYPCEALKVFQAERPHRAELWQDQARIGEVGWEKWLTEKAAHYACPACGTVNSAYDQVCRKCDRTPSCRFVADHQDEIDSFWERQK